MFLRVREVQESGRGMRRTYIYLLFVCIVNIIVLSFLIRDGGDGVKSKCCKHDSGQSDAAEDIKINLSRNYFPREREFTSGNFLIDNHKCRVPDLDIWDAQAIPLLQIPPPPRCNQSEQITYVENSMIIINESEVRKLGYELDDLSCCYKTIHRIAQKRENYDEDADNNYRYSDECYRLEKVTTPKSGFVKVTCKVNTLNPLKTFQYYQFHTVPIFPEEEAPSTNESSLSRKLSFWKDRLKDGGTQLSPNIMVLGIDSTSRINFRRLMHSTMKALNNVIKAVEIKGYTKVGENTFPNFVPFMSSISEEELVKVCYENRWVLQDDCPYIWKDFSRSNYLTALLEDSPKIGTFSYLKTGFVVQPVDIYLRPFMLAAYKHYTSTFAYGGTIDCIGYQRPEKMILDFTVNLARLSNRRQVPFFILSWLTDMSHGKMFGVQHIDKILTQTLLKLHSEKLLDNTLLFVMSDHGFRFHEIRSTKTGWYEDKMPVMWMKLGHSISSSRPDWAKAVKYNSRQLVNVFDMNHALRDILKTFSDPPSLTEEVNPKLLEVLKAKPKLRGLSPFKRIPARTCDEAGIPRGYCPCAAPVEYTNATFIKLAANFFINYVNSKLPSLCMPVSISSVVAFGTPDQRYIGVGSAEGYPETSVMGLKTNPGDFYFEVWLKYDKEKGNFTEVFDVLRMNSMGSKGSCVRVFDEYVDLEMYCYCKNRHFIYSLVGMIM